MATQIQFTTGCLPQHSWVSKCIGSRSHHECNHSRMVLYGFTSAATNQGDYVHIDRKVSLQMICLPQGIAFTAVPSKSIAIGGEHIVTVAVLCDQVVCGFCKLFSVFYDFNLCTVAVMSTSL